MGLYSALRDTEKSALQPPNRALSPNYNEAFIKKMTKTWSQTSSGSPPNSNHFFLHWTISNLRRPFHVIFAHLSLWLCGAVQTHAQRIEWVTVPLLTKVRIRPGSCPSLTSFLSPTLSLCIWRLSCPIKKAEKTAELYCTEKTAQLHWTILLQLYGTN